MNNKQFDDVLMQVLTDIRNTLAIKAQEYADADRLSNFKKAGRLLNCIPEQALLGFVTKHIVALFDFVERFDQAEKTAQPLSTIPDKRQWKEKTHDIIAYIILLWALIEERTPDSDTTNTETNQP